MSPVVGMPMDRTDGIAKVTGQARYAAEFSPPGMVYGYLVRSNIASGNILKIDTHEALHVPGVLQVLTHYNAPRLPQGGRAAVNPPSGRVISVLQEDRVYYNGQPVAVIVAERFESAVRAASKVRVEYQVQQPELVFGNAKLGAYKPKDARQQSPDDGWGDIDTGVQTSDALIDAVYTTPMQTHNPMEPHATIAVWEGEQLTLYDATQGITGTRNTVSKALGIPADHVRVISPFVGGGFGCKGSTWSHVVLAAMAAKTVGRPVKIVLSRQQMFGPVGGRPQTEQRLVLGATKDGRLNAVRHDSLSHTSFMEDFVEPCALQTRMLYATPNAVTTHRLLKLNVGTPTFQRAPGEATGMFALESAMDELAYALNMDPVALRLANHAEKEPHHGKPWSSKSLKQCYEIGARRFGWHRRSSRPASMREGNEFIGYGMATATYPANRMTASASARLLADGTAIVRTGSQDIGTGTYTVMTQVAADALGITPENVRFELGDSQMPAAPISGGSMTVASVAPAVQAACLAVKEKLIELAINAEDSPFARAPAGDIVAEKGWLRLKADPNRCLPYTHFVALNGGQPVEATVESKPGEEHDKYAMHSFGAVFAEVRVDADLGRVHVPRVVGSYAVGKLLNAKTAESQLMGGIVWGISMALLEETHVDQRNGRIVNSNLAEYHVPVNADIGVIDVSFIDEDDPYINPLGAKGIGEIGITGITAAVANAVYHATGNRIRDLPITLDKLLV